MACNSCSTSSNEGGVPTGCGNKGNCGTDSCNKLSVFDWLSNIALPNGEKPFDCVEIRFKNSRKEFYRNTENLTLFIGDVVATEASPGHDIGIVSLTGELVKVQMKKKKVDYNSSEIAKIYRKANSKDIEIWNTSKEKEEAIQKKAREMAIAHKLEMKISDVELQGDGTKIIFYYTANERIDFRDLIKEYAKQFSSRIEMKQVGFRQESSRLGGIGSCGRELCCSTWLTDFRSVSTSAARYQQLSLNPQKLAGQCGKLKCCLNYELDTYLDALKTFPDFDFILKTEKGNARCQKQDIFKGMTWYAYEDNYSNWMMIKADKAMEIITLNKQKQKVTALEDYMEIVEEAPKKDFNNAMGHESLTRFDQPKNKKKKTVRKNQNQVVNPNNNKNLNPNQKLNSNPIQVINPVQNNTNSNQTTNPNQKPNPNQNRNKHPNQNRNQNPNNRNPNNQNPNKDA